MFGTYRTLLALLVVANHLLDIPVIGAYAVHGFFVLSGFLMTLVMHEKYDFTKEGRGRFVVSRSLRLFPSWWVVMIFAAIAIAVVGPSAAEFRRPMFLPGSAFDWLQNALLIFANFYPNQVEPRLSPATWALTVELFYYALICLGFSRTKMITWAWFWAGVIYHLHAQGMADTYFHIFSGSLPFSIGALLYHYKDQLTFEVSRPYLWAFLGTAAIIPLAQNGFSTFYVNMALAPVVIAVLMNAPQNRFDSRIGDFSYHLYILHWPMGLVIYRAFGFSSPGSMLLPFLATLGACIIASVLLTRFVDNPSMRLRRIGLPA